MKLQGGTHIEINENTWKYNEIQWKYIKIQRKWTEMQCGGFAEIHWNCKGVGTLVEINENLLRFNKIQWKYMKIHWKCSENVMWRPRWNSMKLQGGTLVEINENLRKIIEIQWKYIKNTKKMQRTCNAAASPKFNEIARGYPYRNQGKSVKIQWN